MERYSHNSQSTSAYSINDQYITPTNYLSKFSSFIKPSNASNSAFSMKKDR